MSSPFDHNRSFIRHEKELLDCMEIVNKNKINKNNVWRIPLIDDFGTLINNHHNKLRSFHFIGSVLEASSQIYGLRVDLVHLDVLRMSSYLIPRNNESAESSVATDHSNSSEAQPTVQQRVQIKKSKRRQAITVTKNKDLINAKLETVAADEYFIFGKLNSSAKSHNSIQKLLQFVLPSYQSQLLLNMNYGIGNYEQTSVIDVDGDGPTFVLPGELNWMPTCSDIIRPKLTGYQILNTFFEDIGNEPQPIEIGNHSLHEYDFDMNASVDPIPDYPDFMHVDIGSDNFENLPLDDQNALQQCRGVRRLTTIINEVVPDVGSLNLEYSYRKLDEKYNQFWAGPPYWKFCQIQRPVIRRRNRKRKLTLRRILFVEEADESIYIPVISKLTNKIKKWNPQTWKKMKLKLPNDFGFKNNRFGSLSLARCTVLCDDDIADKDVASECTAEDHADDDDYANHPYDIDTMDSRVENAGRANEIQNITYIGIGTELVDPLEPASIIIPTNVIAKTSKVVDMNELGKCCFEIIQKEWAETVNSPNLPKRNDILNEEYENGSALFSNVYEQLPHYLTAAMNEVLSKSIAFSAVLQLANAKKLRLKQENGDFSIRQIRQ